MKKTLNRISAGVDKKNRKSSRLMRMFWMQLEHIREK